jgi:pimeloyl-ACP methyl ester carboxylesterase
VWAREVLTIVRETLLPKAFVVAHSMGGKVAYRAAVKAGDMLGGIAFLDSDCAKGVDPASAAQLWPALRNAADHPYRDSAIAAFRPVGTTVRSPLLRRPRRRSFHSPDGYRLDVEVRPRSVRLGDRDADSASTTELPGRGVAGVKSVIDDESYRRMAQTLDREPVFASLETIGHHMMFDAPRALTAKLQELLTEWAWAHQLSARR